MTFARFLLGGLHTGVAAAWLGAMLYSLFVVQPRARSHLGSPAAFEALALALAAGARWKVLGLIAALAGSGIGLTAVEVATVDGAVAGGWLALMATKAVLLVAATAVFAAVSWRLWPARLFTPPSELAAVQDRFRGVALALIGLVAGALVAGVAADAVGPG